MVKRFEKIWAIIEDVLSSVFLFAGLTIIFFAVIMRYVFNSPWAWADDVSRYLVVWGIFFGASVALRLEEHIKIDFLYDLLAKIHGHLAKALDVAANLIGLIFFAFLVYASSTLIAKAYESGQIVIGIQLPVWILYLILPIMGVMMMARLILNIINIMTSTSAREEDKDPGEYTSAV